MPPLRSLIPIGFAALLGGCTYHLAEIQEPGRAVAFTTTGPWRSMVYAARTDSGVMVVDLGWAGAGHRLRSRLRGLGVAPAEVTDVFLTHSHRDHIAAWRTVRGARFHLWAPEQPLFEGTKRHVDLPSRVARANANDAGPRPGEVDVRPYAGDTTFVVGADTVWAYSVPGHTAGSAAYLFRGVLFVGSGEKGANPLIFQRNGSPYRGFLEGRIVGDGFLLVLHLSNLELKRPEAPAP